MKIAVASGKGGTGKTTVAVGLAWTAAQVGRKVALADCDVEEPNCHIFVKPAFSERLDVVVKTPIINLDRCDGCGECSRFCNWHAIACIAGKAVLFDELCHGCGGCALICPAGAITVAERTAGRIQCVNDWRVGSVGIRFCEGRLEVGSPLSGPVIKAVKRSVDRPDYLAILDAPPGVSCPFVHTVCDCDFVVLVGDSTPFGLHDLKLAAEVVMQLGIPAGVVINGFSAEDDETREYCEQAGLPVLAEIPLDRRIAEVYARGGIVPAEVSSYRPTFERLLERVEELLPERIVPES